MQAEKELCGRGQSHVDPYQDETFGVRELREDGLFDSYFRSAAGDQLVPEC